MVEKWELRNVTVHTALVFAAAWLLLLGDYDASRCKQPLSPGRTHAFGVTLDFPQPVSSLPLFLQPAMGVCVCRMGPGSEHITPASAKLGWQMRMRGATASVACHGQGWKHGLHPLEPSNGQTGAWSRSSTCFKPALSGNKLWYFHHSNGCT